MLSEISQTERKTYTVWSLWYVESKREQKQKQKNKLVDTENNLVVARGRQGEKWVNSFLVLFFSLNKLNNFF